MDSFWSVFDRGLLCYHPEPRVLESPIARRLQRPFAPARECERALQSFLARRLRRALARVFEGARSRTLEAIDAFLGAPSLAAFACMYKRVLGLLLRYRFRLGAAELLALARQVLEIAAFVYRDDPPLVEDLRRERTRALAALRGPPRTARDRLLPDEWFDDGASVYGFVDAGPE